MTITKDHIGGLLFLGLSVVYGYYAYEIRMFPGDQLEPFNAQTVPIALAWLSGVIALLMLATASKSEADILSFAGLDLLLVTKLMVLVWVFAQALEWVGFLVSTIGFLMAGYWLLGERRFKTLLMASVPFALCFWYLLAEVLDIYLAPGQLWRLMGV